jgi:hypothetical protein
MKLSFSAIFLLLGITAANAQTPVVKNGSCPTGYYTSGNYCVPYRNTERPAIPKVGSCPTGYYTSGNYCVRY